MYHKMVNTQEVLGDIRSGLDDDELMEKYLLSAPELQSIYRDLVDQGHLKRMDRFSVAPSERTISAREVVEDLRAGTSVSDLMTKYRLSVRGLQGLLTILVDTGTVSRDELYGDGFVEQEAVLPESFRCRTRFYLDFEIPIYESSRPEVQARIHDITEDGVGIIGLEVQVDEITHLVVLGDALGEVAPFEFEARCRWCTRDERSGMSSCGFEITYISEKDRTQLIQLISLLTFSG